MDQSKLAEWIPACNAVSPLFCDFNLTLVPLHHTINGADSQHWERGQWHMVTLQQLLANNEQLQCGSKWWGWLCFLFYGALDVPSNSFFTPLFHSFLTLVVIPAPKHTMSLYCHWLATSHMTGVSADQILGERGNFFYQDERKKMLRVCVQGGNKALFTCWVITVVLSRMLWLAVSRFRMWNDPLNEEVSQHYSCWQCSLTVADIVSGRAAEPRVSS